MTKVPTAKKFYNNNPETIQDIGKGRSAHTKRMMIEFAKLHVEAALKAAKEVDKKNRLYKPKLNQRFSILNAYPETNIV